MTDWDREVDVVVLGTGGAGLTAALAAVVEGASVEVYEKAATVGGTTAVSGGIVWIPAHNRMPDRQLTVDDAMSYLRAQSLGFMDEELVETFVRAGPVMLDFVEAHTDLRFEIAAGFPDYKPELPGGQPSGGRSLNAGPYELSRLGEWRDRITSFPADFSNVGIDAETRARIHAAVDQQSDDVCVAGAALIGGLLKGLLDRGVVPHTNARAVELTADALGITGVRIELPGKTIQVRARRGVILACGGFEWDASLVGAFLRGPMHGAVSPPKNTGDGLRMAMAHGADLANMGEAWWVPIVQIPGDTIDGHPRSRSVRLERTRPRSIIVNRGGRRFVNEAGEYNSMAGAFHYLDPEAVTSTTRRGSSSTPFTSSAMASSGSRRATLFRNGSARLPISPSWAPRRASTRTGWPIRLKRGIATSPTRSTLISVAAQAHTTDTGATNAPPLRPARRSDPSTPRPITRYRFPSARWAPRAVPAPTATAAFFTSGAQRSPGSTPRATRWPA